MIVCIDTVAPETSKLLREWSQSQGVVFKEFAERKFNLTQVSLDYDR